MTKRILSDEEKTKEGKRMKVGVKKLIIAIIEEKIRSYERSIDYCKTSRPDNRIHIEKLEFRKDRLQRAVEEMKNL